MADWLPAIITTTAATALMTAVGWAVKAIVEAKVKSEFDAKLETLRSDLRSKETELDALRRNALSGAAARAAIVDKRRIEAIEKVWSYIHKAGSARFIIEFMKVIKIESLISATEAQRGGEGLQNFAGTLYDMAKFDEIWAIPVRLEEPFISPSAWAYYKAHAAVFCLCMCNFGNSKNRIAIEYH